MVTRIGTKGARDTANAVDRLLFGSQKFGSSGVVPLVAGLVTGGAVSGVSEAGGFVSRVVGLVSKGGGLDTGSVGLDTEGG